MLNTPNYYNKVPSLFWFDSFLEAKTEIKKIMRTRKFAFEINWPLRQKSSFPDTKSWQLSSPRGGSSPPSFHNQRQRRDPSPNFHDTESWQASSPIGGASPPKKVLRQRRDSSPNFHDTGKSLSEALLFADHGENMLQDWYVVYRNCSELR